LIVIATAERQHYCRKKTVQLYTVR